MRKVAAQMRKRTLVSFLIVLVIIAVGITYSQVKAGSGGPPSLFPTGGAITYAPGVQAITPSDSSAKYSSMVLAAGVKPLLTEADVRAYLAQGGMPPVVSGGSPSIVAIQFITASQVNTLTKDAFHDRPGDVTVCYVLLKGPFDFVISHPVVPAGVDASVPGSTPASINYVEEVFDAYSGNLLMWGIPANM